VETVKISRVFDDPTARAMLEQAERRRGEALAIIAGAPGAPLMGVEVARELKAASSDQRMKMRMR
jgi:hypothetical protein